MDAGETAKELNDQLLRAWSIYIKFFTVFLTVNIAAFGLILPNSDPMSAVRLIVGITFVIQNAIAVVTGIEMANYTRCACESLSALDAAPLSRFGRLGYWGGMGNALGNGIIGLTWVVVLWA